MSAAYSRHARITATAVLLSICAWVGAADKRYPWDRRTPDCFGPAALNSPARHCAPAEWGDFDEARSNFHRLLFDADYDRDHQLVERAANELGFSSARFASGEYHFEALYSSMVDNFQFGGPHAASRAKAWLTAGPNGYAQLAHALVHYGRAWQIRTNRAARTVSPEAWELFYANLEDANATLDAAAPKLKQFGPWHALKLSIAFEHPKYAAERLKLLQSAVAAWPDYLALYVIPMERMHPKRGGSFELMEGVAQYTLSLTRPTHGAAMYALAYERVFRTEREYTIEDSAVDWLLLKDGIRDIERRRVIVTPLLWKSFAQLACHMRDKPEARRLYDLRDGLLNGALPDDADPCRAFALGD